jgi:hypothetical protein
MSTQRVKGVSRNRQTIKRSINEDTWSNIKELVKNRKLQKIQEKQMFYEKFSNISKILETRASSLNSTLNDKIIITSVPKNSEPGKMFKLYIDGSLVNIKCPENTTPGSKIRFTIKKTRNIHREVQTLVNFRKSYRLIYKTGSYYGYPKCCINDFVIRLHNNQQCESIQELAGRYTGFIPCIKCSEQIFKKKLEPHEIIKNRSCKTEFPFDDEGHDIIPCKKHALLIFLNKMTMREAIKSGCKDCYASDTEDEDDDGEEYEEYFESEQSHNCCKCRH